MKQSLFEQYPKTTLTLSLLVLGLIAIALIEWSAKQFFGLGKVVLYEAHPIYGYRVAPNQTVARNPHQRIHINNLGLRANTDWDLNQDNPRVLFLGDSVTYGGSYVDNADLFSTQIGQKISQCETGNAAVNGWGVDNVVAFVRDKPFLDATLYVLVFPEGDFYRGLTRIGGQPFWTRHPKYALEELWQYGVYRSSLKKTPHLHAYNASESEKKRIVHLATTHLNDLLCFLKSHNKQVLIYISPSLPQALGEEQPDPIIKQSLNDYGIPANYLLDKIPATMSKCEKKALFHDVIHLSPQGHTFWANMMLEDVKENINQIGSSYKNS